MASPCNCVFDVFPSFSGEDIRVFDVFPSFSGEDIRVTFLSHFLKELDQKLISVFKDSKIKKSKSIGPELEQAIRGSRIAVVVFSKNYASSSWCLDELLEIVKCNEEMGQMVVPIFYGLDPSHVRKQTGEFGKAFEKTCQNKTEEVKNKWKQALTNVANILGYHSLTWSNEANMIEEIANDIMVKMNLTPFKDFEDFVGIEAHIAEMSLLLSLESKEAMMVGIWGQSGIGKTTIARALFSRISRHFQGRVFIDRAFISTCKESYREANPDDYDMKLHLQQIFLSKILNRKDIKTDHLGAVGERLKHQKVLIVIDDLDDQMVLDALAGQTEWFGCGSRIIVITKDKHLLRAHEIDHIYEVRLPSEALALEMFNRSAFKQNSSPYGFEKLASEFVVHVGRLPLAMHVLGSCMRGRDKEYWMDMLPRLPKNLDGKIEKALKVSYDGLCSKEDKAIFRHIACLFNYEKVNDIKLMLANSDLDVNIGLRNLVDKSLIHINRDIVNMHCLIQEMGKEIVRIQSYEPGEREFVVDTKEICDLLEDNTGTKKVLGISLNVDEIDELTHVHEKAFERMKNLRFLKFYTKVDLLSEKEVRLHLPEGFNYLPPKLSLLSWDRFPMRHMPSKFRPQNLVKLIMRDSNLDKLWEGIGPLACLKNVDLRGSKNLKEIPNLLMATNLETLNLRYCSSLVEIPSSIRNLNKLVDLIVTQCTKLEILPTGINLESLSELYVHQTAIDDFPSNMKTEKLLKGTQNLNKLTKLGITESINLKSLDCLALSGCSKLKIFPHISTNISELHINGTGIEEVPWWIDKFSRLQFLFMGKCNNIQNVSLNISKLERLAVVDFSDCMALVEATWHGHPKVSLSFMNCFKLNQEALLQRQLVFKQLILPGGEVPLYFTHPANGASLINIPLLYTSHSQPFLKVRACLVVDVGPVPAFRIPIVDIKVWCRLRDINGNQIDSVGQAPRTSTSHLGIHLVIFDCRLPLKNDNDPLDGIYSHVDIKFHLSCFYTCKIKGCGIQLTEDSPATENLPRNPDVLEHVSESDESKLIIDKRIDHGEEEPRRKRRCMQVVSM